MRNKVYMNDPPSDWPEGSFHRSVEKFLGSLDPNPLEGTNILRQFNPFHQALPLQANCRFCGKPMSRWKNGDICKERLTK